MDVDAVLLLGHIDVLSGFASFPYLDFPCHGARFAIRASQERDWEVSRGKSSTNDWRRAGAEVTGGSPQHKEGLIP